MIVQRPPTTQGPVQIDEIESIASNQVNSKKSAEVKAPENNDQDARRVFLNLDDEKNAVAESQFSFNNGEVPSSVVFNSATGTQEDDGSINDEDIIILAPEGVEEVPVVEKELEETINTAPHAGDDVALDVNEGAAIINGETNSPIVGKIHRRTSASTDRLTAHESDDFVPEMLSISASPCARCRRSRPGSA